MRKQYYNLTCTQIFYGQKDVKTYYKVKEADILSKCRYMAENFNVANVFIYEAGAIGKNKYYGSYSRKWDNIKVK